MLLFLTTFMGLAFDNSFCVYVSERRVIAYLKWFVTSCLMGIQSIDLRTVTSLKSEQQKMFILSQLHLRLVLYHTIFVQ